MFIANSTELSLMSGYQDLDNPHWRRYYLLDAVAKAKNSELHSAEVKINRGKIKDLSLYPIVGSWPLIPESDLAEVIQRQLHLGRQASLAFQKVPLQIRVELLRSFGRRLKNNAEYWRQMMVQESYSFNAFLGSFDSALQIFKSSYLNMMEGLLSPSHKPGSFSRIEHVPQGIIGVISPQNSSFPMLTQILHGAILTANAVMVKPPHRLAMVALSLVREFNEFLAENGMPDGLISTVTHVNTQRVMEHWLGLNGGTEKIDNLIFIGNSKRRDNVIATCQKAHIFNPIIELEGIDAAYVHQDLSYDQLKKVAQLIAYGKNMAAGQMCVSLKRLYVQSRVYPKFMEFLKAELKKYRPGSLLEDDPYILGPSSLAHKLKGFIQAFEEQGAYVSQGGRRLNYRGEEDPQGQYIDPTIIEGVQADSPLLQEEIFANILPVVEVNGDISEVIQQINFCPFGLRATLYANDPDVIEQLTRELRVGTVVINGNPQDFSLQIAGGRGLTTLDQNARIWPLDMSLRRVVTGGQGIGSLRSLLEREQTTAAPNEKSLKFPKIPTVR